jgi:hypothetical protein
MQLNNLIKYSFIFFLLCAITINAQVLIPTPESAFENQHPFNPGIIKTKGIKRICFEIIDKKDFEVAVDKNLTEMYEFNQDGLLSRHYYTTIARSIEKHVTTVNRKKKKITHVVNDYIYDTVSTTYFYNGNNLILKRFHDGNNYYESRYYRYDSLGNLTKEMRFRETNNSPDRSVFILGNQVLLSVDSFQYHRYSSGQVKCIFYNDENRPYKEMIINFDSLGRKKNVNENYTAAAWLRQEQSFEYKGDKLCKARFEGNANNKVLLLKTCEYDEKNELYSEKQFRNELLIKETSYVTDRSNGLLNSFVIRDPNNKTMRIVKLKYDFGSIGNTVVPGSSGVISEESR